MEQNFDLKSFSINILKNQYKNPDKLSFPSFNEKEMQKAMAFHQTLPGYAKTPLLSLSGLAKHLELGGIYVKDESLRFDVQSFKVLGSSYALSDILEAHIVVTATDGNHGRGLAWAAKHFGKKARVYMPKGSSFFRLNKILQLGAHAEITDLNYDDTVRYARCLAEEHGWTLVQDTALDNYTDIPLRIMQGYLTVVGECLQQLPESPTHIILQAGVGSFAAAIAGSLQQLIQKPLIFIIVEPIEADCLYQSACSGKVQKTKGSLSTIMAGLSCGEPNPLAWDILKEVVDFFVICQDSVSEKGMCILGNPLNGDSRIISGESGAVPMGFLMEACKSSVFKQSLRLDSSSRIFFINTEGDTDPESYRAICCNTNGQGSLKPGRERS